MVRASMKLRKAIFSLWLLFVFGLWMPTTLAQQQAEEHLKSVASIGITVSDMDRSVKFYSKVLAFQKVSDVEVSGSEYEHLQGIFGLRMRVVRMKLGDESIELIEYLTPKGRPIPVDSRSNDHWFQHIAIVVSDMDKAYQHLLENKVQQVSTGPQRLPDWNKAAGGIKAFYFRDPDEHNLEIIYFPPGKGSPKRQRPNDKLFLGIDHTAIVVGDTEASLKFYRDLLGMRVAGESENYGTEQEHLNNVFGARLRITSLRAETGPGIELLEYLTPRNGRSIQDMNPNDIAHWQTILETSNAEALAKQLRAGKFLFLSSDIVAISNGKLGFKRGFSVEDPDGHTIEFIEK